MVSPLLPSMGHGAPTLSRVIVVSDTREISFKLNCFQHVLQILIKNTRLACEHTVKPSYLNSLTKARPNVQKEMLTNCNKTTVCNI